MQRSSTNAPVSGYGSPIDRSLLAVKATLERSYWASREGVFEFQFTSDDSPLVNTTAPMYFQLVRYTPDYSYEAFSLVIPGRLNTDGSFEYGGGRLGILVGDGIRWNDGGKWLKVNNVNRARDDSLNIKDIQAQAIVDDAAIGDIVQKYYLY